MKRKILTKFSALLLVLFSITGLKAQFPGCPDVTVTDQPGLADVNNVIHLNCSNSCINLISTPFQVGLTNSYAVGSIPATPPIPYNQTGGTAVSVNIDDVWSPVVNLPFNFCFYGQSYNKCQISSNGSIKFGANYTAGSNAGYTISSGIPSGALSARGDVFGVYHDINPSITATNPSIKWYLVGQAPCRMLCVIYKDVAHFSCTTIKSTFMMVLYETTNVIDVYVDSKPTCTTWNNGAAIIGLQNPSNPSVGITAPGRNYPPTWTVTTPEAWRFTPNGTDVYTSKWYANGVMVSTGDTINVCPSDSTVYKATVDYTRCDGTIVTAADSMTVIPPATAPQITTNISSPACGIGTGSVTLNVTGGTAPYQYSSDNVNWTSNNTFSNLGFGNFVFYAKGADGCTANVLVSFQPVPPITINQDSLVNNKCFGETNGLIHVSTTGGAGGYTYSLNNGAYQSSGNFDNLLAGNYSIIVKDANGCKDTSSYIITEPTQLITTSQTMPVSCYGQADGAIIMTTTGGVTPYSYNLDGQNVFSSSMPNLLDGPHVVIVKDGNGCTVTDSVTVPGSASALIIGINGDTLVCSGQSSNISVTATGGSGSYTYLWSNGSTSPSFSNTITSATTYTVEVKDAAGCIQKDTINVNVLPPMTADVNPEYSEGLPGLVVTFTNSSSNADNYTWNFGNGNSATSATTASQTQTFSTPGTYIVILTAKNIACSISDSATVLINPYPTPEIIAPNVFTPNGDGINDFWKITFTNVDKVEVIILNRWGNVMDKLTDITKEWDGKVNGKEASDGTYFYKYEITDFNGKKYTGNGMVTLHR